MLELVLSITIIVGIVLLLGAISIDIGGYKYGSTKYKIHKYLIAGLFVCSSIIVFCTGYWLYDLIFEVLK